MLTKTEHAHFNDLKFMFKIDFKHNFCNIINDIILCFHDYKNSKKTLSEFIHIINIENFVFLLINHCSDFIIEIYQDFQKTFSEFIYTTYINSSIILFCYYDSDFVIEFSSFSMHDNCADIFIIASASCSCCQYKNVKFINFTDDFDDMIKLDKFSFIAAISNHLFCDFNAKKQQLNADSHTSSKTYHHIQLSTQNLIDDIFNYDFRFIFLQQ